MTIAMPDCRTQLYDLAQPLFTGMPSSVNHPGFRMALLRRHGDHVRSDGTSASNELIITGGHVGTHMDALAHMSHHGQLYGGVDAAKAQEGGRFSTHGIEQVPIMAGRGVLLDVAGAMGVRVLPAGYEITESDLEATARKFDVKVEGAEFILVRSGWSAHFDDAEAFRGHESGVPGPNAEAGKWLAAQRIRATGADTIAYEHIPAKLGHAVLPVHRTLLVEHGIHIVEVMNLDPLAEAACYEFGLLLAPLKIVGATGSPLRPVAWAL